MKKPIMAFMLLLTAAIGFNPAAHAKIPLGELDANMLFGQSSHNVDVMALSEREMVETEGEFWPLVYGAAWLGARAAIWAAPRLSSSFRAVSSSNNHRILLRNNNHVLQTGGFRGNQGFGQNASHIGWGQSSRGNFSNSHLYYNSPWRIR